MELRAQFRPAFMLLVLLTILTGFAYPIGFTGLAQLIFPVQANGSLIMEQGRAVGSTLIGQPFDDARYFWGRLSATAPSPYNAAASSGRMSFVNAPITDSEPARYLSLPGARRVVNTSSRNARSSRPVSPKAPSSSLRS